MVSEFIFDFAEDYWCICTIHAYAVLAQSMASMYDIVMFDLA